MKQMFAEIGAVCGLIAEWMDCDGYWVYSDANGAYPVSECARPKAPEWAWGDLKVLGEIRMRNEMAIERWGDDVAD